MDTKQKGSISTEDYAFIQELSKQLTGIILSEGKEYLVQARLAPLGRSLDFQNLDDFIKHIRTSLNDELKEKLIDALTINETSFFRDHYIFLELERTVFPKLIEKRKIEKKIHIWSAACSSGQEPYTIAMILKKLSAQLVGWDIQIFATDLSQEAIEQAKKGAYSKIEINRGLPAPLLIKYFEQERNKWVAKDEIRSMIKFHQMNLLNPWFSIPKTIDLLLMRNVLIYFDIPTRKKIFDQVTRVLQPDGLMFLGNAETTMNVHDGFEREGFGKTFGFKIKQPAQDQQVHLVQQHSG